MPTQILAFQETNHLPQSMLKTSCRLRLTLGKNGHPTSQVWTRLSPPSNPTKNCSIAHRSSLRQQAILLRISTTLFNSLHNIRRATQHLQILAKVCLKQTFHVLRWNSHPKMLTMPLNLSSQEHNPSSSWSNATRFLDLELTIQSIRDQLNGL